MSVLGSVLVTYLSGKGASSCGGWCWQPVGCQANAQFVWTIERGAQEEGESNAGSRCAPYFPMSSNNFPAISNRITVPPKVMTLRSLPFFPKMIS
eukprot:4401779-Amphidinium_carterae.1